MKPDYENENGKSSGNYSGNGGIRFGSVLTTLWDFPVVITPMTNSLLASSQGSQYWAQRLWMQPLELRPRAKQQLKLFSLVFLFQWNQPTRESQTGEGINGEKGPG